MVWLGDGLRAWNRRAMAERRTFRRQGRRVRGREWRCCLDLWTRAVLSVLRTHIRHEPLSVSRRYDESFEPPCLRSGVTFRQVYR